MRSKAPGASPKEVPVNLATVVALCVFAFLGIGTALNPDLVSTRFSLATGFGMVEAPVILLLVLFTAGSWFLFLVINSVSQDPLLRKIERLSGSVAEKERELLKMKASFFDESVETLQGAALRLDRRLRELEPVLNLRRAESFASPGAGEPRTAHPEPMEGARPRGARGYPG
jgi:hypothetical protein